MRDLARTRGDSSVTRLLLRFPPSRLVLLHHLAGAAAPFCVRIPRALYTLQPRDEDDEARVLETRLFTEPVIVLDDVGAERDRSADWSTATTSSGAKIEHIFATCQRFGLWRRFAVSCCRPSR